MDRTTLLVRVMVAFLTIASCVLLASCAPEPEQDAFGSPDAVAELHIVADSTLQAQVSHTGGKAFVETVQSTDLEHITFAEPLFIDANDGIGDICQIVDDNPDLDMVFARGEVVDALSDAGYVTGNATALNIAEIPILDNVYLVAVRKAGSSAELPETRLVSGSDDAQSNEWRLAYLPDWGGVAAACPDTTPAGKAFNQALASVGLYDNESGEGGTYAASVRDEITVADSPADAIDLVLEDKADLAFVYSFDTTPTDNLDAFYEVPIQLYSWRPNYKGAVLANCENQAAARWYLNVLYKQI